LQGRGPLISFDDANISRSPATSMIDRILEKIGPPARVGRGARSYKALLLRRNHLLAHPKAVVALHHGLEVPSK